MCLLVFAFRSHPVYRLILAANRDEFYLRQTQKAHFWEDAPDLLAGKDLEKGGTWLGLTKQGRIAAITNHRSGLKRDETKLSRGRLVTDFLLGELEPHEFIAKIDPSSYNGFHLVFGSVSDLFYFSNQDAVLRRLDGGIYGLSNALLGTEWHKIKRATSALTSIIQSNDVSPETLFELLSDRTPAKDEDLPDTGVGLEIERYLSPIFISGDKYGTCSSSVLLVAENGYVTFIERSFGQQGKFIGEVKFEFELELPKNAENFYQKFSDYVP